MNNRSEEIQIAERYLEIYRAGQLTEKTDLIKALNCKWFRLNSLYKIKTKKSAIDSNEEETKDRIQVFKPNAAQLQRYVNGFNRDIILKARQLGFTTFEMIDALDDCLFINDFSAGCIAHRFSSAKDIFRNKIKFAYQHIPKKWLDVFELLGLDFPVPTNDKGEGYIFSNGSSIHVDVNYRGDTLQRLHISEFGKICAKNPDTAKEIVTGAFEAVPLDGQLTIESTAEGRSGYFFDYCQTAKASKLAGRALSKLDFKFHFFPWWQEPGYTLDPKGVIVSNELKEYFEEKELEITHKFTPGQIAWYAKKILILGDDMRREYPTTPEEAFEEAIEGAYYSKQVKLARAEKRIAKVPYDPSLPVFTFWDLGRNDTNAIWFMQRSGLINQFVDYYENNGESLQFYAKILRDKGYLYDLCHLPHDASVVDLTREDNKSRAEVLEDLGFKVKIVPRIQDINEGIHMTRSVFGSCWFDEEKCDTGLVRLESYRKDWNEKTQTYRERPAHTEASNGADAFRQFAQGFMSITPRRKRRRAKGGMAA